MIVIILFMITIGTPLQPIVLVLALIANLIGLYNHVDKLESRAVEIMPAVPELNTFLNHYAFSENMEAENPDLENAEAEQVPQSNNEGQYKTFNDTSDGNSVPSGDFEYTVADTVYRAHKNPALDDRVKYFGGEYNEQTADNVAVNSQRERGTRVKRSIDSSISKRADYYKQHYADECEQVYEREWWGAYDY